MEQNSTERLVYLARIPRQQTEQLKGIRHWKGIKIALQEKYVWLKGFSANDLQKVALRSLYGLELFEQKGNLLYQLGAHLAAAKAPHLLWTPIEKGLPVEKPLPNPNYFGIDQKVNIRLQTSQAEQEPFALLTSVAQVGQYLLGASSIRLKNLQWTILNEDQALIIGTPLLPIPGQTFWKLQQHLLPTGWHFNYPSLAPHLQAQNNPAGLWMLWHQDASYTLIGKRMLVPLRLSSYRLTVSNTTVQKQ